MAVFDQSDVKLRVPTRDSSQTSKYDRNDKNVSVPSRVILFNKPHVPNDLNLCARTRHKNNSSLHDWKVVKLGVPTRAKYT